MLVDECLNDLPEAGRKTWAKGCHDMGIEAEAFFLRADDAGTLQQQIKRLVVDGVLSGRFRSGERMPSSRSLAKQLGVSRITITLAYTDLVADDYLTARGRSGYFVSDTAPRTEQRRSAATGGRSTVDWARLLPDQSYPSAGVFRPADWRRCPYPFIYGQIDPALFDSQNWRRCALQALGQKEFDSLTSDHYERDDPNLVDYIQTHILNRRGIDVGPDSILITMGAQNALWLAAQLLLTQRRTAVLENPGYPGLQEILSQTRSKTVAMDVDQNGLDPASLPEAFDVVFTTVSHQCPTNATMPIARRLELLKRAEKDGFVIVEDDYEFELAFGSPSVPSLKSLDQAGVVIHVGSFSKSLFPGLRLGYLVAPPAFVEAARAMRATVLRHPPGLAQRTAANFLSLGHYDSQIKRMRNAYRHRRDVMRAAIEDSGFAKAGLRSSGGSCFWLKLVADIDTEVLAERLYARGVVVEPGRAFFADNVPPRNYLRLAYSSISADRIPRGIEIIAEEIAQF